MAHVTFTRARLQATAALAGGLGLWWRFHTAWSIALAGFMAALALLAWFAPERHQPVQRAFDWGTRCLVAGFTWLILGVVYFGLFTPMRLFGMLVGRDPLGLKSTPRDVQALALQSAVERDRRARRNERGAPSGRALPDAPQSETGANGTSATATYLSPIPAPTEGRFNRQF